MHLGKFSNLTNNQLKMRKYGLIGFPLGHSFSKKYFTEKFLVQHVSECSYDNYPIKSLDGLTKLIESDQELAGLNVTIPYKTEIIRLLNKIDPEAEEIGAVNVVKITWSSGLFMLSGYNSDATGIRDTLSPYITDNVRNALILGTGGSSRAVNYVLGKFGLNVKLVSRERKPGILAYSDITRSILENTHLIVNTTPLGMFPNVEGSPEIDYSGLNGNQILFDLVYNPEITTFLRKGAEKGCNVISGIKMLYSQAEKSWDIWNDDSFV